MPNSFSSEAEVFQSQLMKFYSWTFARLRVGLPGSVYRPRPSIWKGSTADVSPMVGPLRCAEEKDRGEVRNEKKGYVRTEGERRDRN